MTWDEFLKFAHIIGTVLGVGGATYVELIYRRANADGKINQSESDILRLMFMVLRLGLLLIVLSGFGFFLQLRLEGPQFVLFLPGLWMKLSLTVLLLFNAVILQMRLWPAWFGGAISIVAWYAAAFLGIWRSVHPSYLVMGLAYIVFVALVAGWFRATDEKKPART